MVGLYDYATTGTTGPATFADAIGNVLQAYTCLDADFHINAFVSKLLSFRVFTFTILMFGALNFWIYNAGLVSYLTIVSYDNPISGLRDILEDERLVLPRRANSTWLLFTNMVRLPLYDCV